MLFFLKVLVLFKGQSLPVVPTAENKANKFTFSLTMFISTSRLSHCSLMQKKDLVKLKLKLFMEQWESPVLNFKHMHNYKVDIKNTYCVPFNFVFLQYIAALKLLNRASLFYVNALVFLYNRIYCFVKHIWSSIIRVL